MAKCAWRLLTAVLVLGGMAFTSNPEVYAQDGAGAADAQRDDDDDMDYGWIGLLGLLGLAGLMRRDRDRHVDHGRGTTPGGR